MKCEVCGEEIVVVCEEIFPTDANGMWHPWGMRKERNEVGLRCDCYDCEGHEACPYHIADGVVMRDEPPAPGPFDDLVNAQKLTDAIFSTCPVLKQMRNDNRQPPGT